MARPLFEIIGAPGFLHANDTYVGYLFQTRNDSDLVRVVSTEFVLRLGIASRIQVS